MDGTAGTDSRVTVADEMPGAPRGRQGRKGGRDARRALRSQPLEQEKRAIAPGLQGGAYNPLSQKDVEAIHSAVLQVLSEIGLADAIPSCIEVTTARGAFLNDHGRLCFPPALVEWALKVAGRRFALPAQDPALDIEPWDRKVHFGTAGAAVHMVDPRSREYRESELTDLYDIARMVDALDNVHFLQRPIIARDMTDPRDLDLNTLYACLAGTRKHIGTRLHPARKCRAWSRDAAHGGRIGSRLAGPAVCQHVELLCRPATEICRGCLPVP